MGKERKVGKVTPGEKKDPHFTNYPEERHNRSRWKSWERRRVRKGKLGKGGDGESSEAPYGSAIILKGLRKRKAAFRHLFTTS